MRENGGECEEELSWEFQGNCEALVLESGQSKRNRSMQPRKKGGGDADVDGGDQLMETTVGDETVYIKK